MAVDPARGIQECSEVSQMKAETEILIYKLVLVVKIYVLSLQMKIETWKDKKAAHPRTWRVKDNLELYTLAHQFQTVDIMLQVLYHSLSLLSLVVSIHNLIVFCSCVF